MEERFSKKGTKFIDHWVKPTNGKIPAPTHEKDPQTHESVMPDDWLKYVDSDYIFVSRKDFVDGNNPSHFYCSVDNKWYSLADTIGNVKKHLKSSHHAKEYKAISETVISNIANSCFSLSFTDLQKKAINNCIKGMILDRGLPFDTIEDIIVKRTLNFLGKRDKFREDTITLGQRIQDALYNIMQESHLLSIAYDVWKDKSCKKYFGITGKCFYRGEFKSLLLALEPVECETSIAMKNAYDRVISRYSISGKIISVVSDNCNAMLSLANMLNVLRFPCMCHVLDRILVAYLSPKMKLIDSINSNAASLKCNSAFRNFLRNKGAPSILLYTQVRWESLKELIDSLENCWQYINEYFQQINKEVPIKEYEFKEFMGLRPFVDTINTNIHVFENDNFANSSLILSTFDMIESELNAELKDLSLKQCASSALTKLNKIKNKFASNFHPFLDAAVYVNPCMCKNSINIPAAKAYINKYIELLQKAKQEQKIEEEKQVQTHHYTIFDDRNAFYLRDQQRTINVVDKLETETLDGDQNTLFNYWLAKLNDPDWSELANVAIIILSILVSSCSVERAFSTSGRCKTRDRLRIMDSAFEAQVLYMANEEIGEKLLNF